MIAHGDIDKAEQIIADLEATTIDDPWVVTESKGTSFSHNLFKVTSLNHSIEIQWAAQFERENGMSWFDLLKGKTGAGNTCTIRRLLLGAGTQAMQQLAGINQRNLFISSC